MNLVRQEINSVDTSDTQDGLFLLYWKEEGQVPLFIEPAEGSNEHMFVFRTTTIPQNSFLMTNREEANKLIKALEGRWQILEIKDKKELSNNILLK